METGKNRRTLSIIIPLYDAEAYVGKALESIFDTTASSGQFEVIVVNDGSTDGSLDVVKKFADRPNLTVLDLENQGPSAARMSGFPHAQGEYIWFMDSDDYLVEDGVGKVLRLLEDRPGVDVLMFPLVRTDGEDFPLDYRIDGEMRMEGKDIVKNPALPEWSAPRYVLKRSLMENPWVRFPKGLIHEDNYIGIVLLYLAKDVRVMKDPVYIHLIRPGSVMMSLTKKSSYDMVAIHRLLRRFMKEVMDPSEWDWLRKYSFKLLEFCNDRFPVSGLGKKGLYLWCAWKEAYPESSWKTKVKRFLFFSMPQTFARYR